MTERSRALSLVLSCLVVLAVVGGAAALVWAAERGPTPPPGAPGTRTDTAAPRGDGALLIAGSGSNLPLMQVLLAELAVREPALRVRLAPSIGSSGGIRAVRDGVIDVALVSRPLRPAELEPDLRVHPYARTAVVLAAHPDVRDRELSAATLLAALAPSTPGTDGALVPILREPGDSALATVMASMPDLERAYAAAWARGELPARLTDQAMEQALLSIPGAIGFFDLGIITTRQLPLRALSLDGLEATPEALASGRYPHIKQLALVLPAQADPRTAPLLELILGPDGQHVIAAHGYLPVTGARR